MQRSPIKRRQGNQICSTQMKFPNSFKNKERRRSSEDKISLIRSFPTKRSERIISGYSRPTKSKVDESQVDIGASLFTSGCEFPDAAARTLRRLEFEEGGRTCTGCNKHEVTSMGLSGGTCPVHSNHVSTLHSPISALQVVSSSSEAQIKDSSHASAKLASEPMTLSESSLLNKSHLIPQRSIQLSSSQSPSRHTQPSRYLMQSVAQSLLRSTPQYLPRQYPPPHNLPSPIQPISHESKPTSRSSQSSSNPCTSVSNLNNISHSFSQTMSTHWSQVPTHLSSNLTLTHSNLSSLNVSNANSENIVKSKYSETSSERVDEEQIGEQITNTTENMKKAIRELFADFDKVRRDLQISKDPLKWSEGDVVRWLHWSVHQFNLDFGVVSCLSGSTGQQLINDGQQAFLSRSPPFAGDILWEHLEILRDEANQALSENQPFTNDHPLNINLRMNSSQPMPLSGQPLPSGGQALTTRGQSSGAPLRVCSNSRLNSLTREDSKSTKTQKSKNDENDGGDGHLRLWQFILLLLLDRQKRHIISWTGCKWEFRIFDTNEVARLWGQYKNRPLMTYEKLSRALRYYYDKGFVVKVLGKRFHYAFTWSLEKLLEKIPRHHLQFP